MIDRLVELIEAKGNPSVVGLDPRIELLPPHLVDTHIRSHGLERHAFSQAVWEFNQAIIEAVHDIVPAVKPQAAYYEQLGPEGMDVLARTIDLARERDLYVIVDAKRNDIGSTSQAYAAAYLGGVKYDGRLIPAFSSDAVTVNPYLGSDGVEPFVRACRDNRKAIFVLVKTSNPSSGEFQDVIAGDHPLYRLVARKVREWGEHLRGGSGYSSVGAVVGATYPQQADELRRLMPAQYFLVPGYGAQGAGSENLGVFFNPDRLGALISSSRAILYAYRDPRWREKEYARAAREAALDMKHDLTQMLDRLI